MTKTICVLQTPITLGSEGRIFADQLELPSGVTSNRVHVMVPGGMHSGASWIVTPDQRSGWAPMLAERGDRVICLDWPGCGRSGYSSPDKVTSRYIVEQISSALEELDGELFLWVHSMSGPFGWKIAENLGRRLSSLVAIAPGPPGNTQPHANVVSNDDGSRTAILFGRPWSLRNSTVFPPEPDFTYGKFVEHSAHFPRETFDRYFSGLHAIPMNLVLDRLNVDGRQLCIDRFDRLKDTRIFIVTGGEDPDHSRDVDSAIHEFFIQNGLDSTFVYLPDHDMHGHGHMVMLERNNEKVLELIYNNLIPAER